MVATRILLAPGASGSIERLRPHQRGLAQRGFDVELVTLPRGTAERALPVYRAALDAEEEPGSVAIGGQSFGGRVASMIASDAQAAAVVVFSYPLHAPGRRDAWAERTAHWPGIACPVLLLSGESDPFAELKLLRRAADQLPDGTLVTYPRQGHSLTPVLDDALERVAAFLAAKT